ncbi:hypothetical protein P170DRAFT_385589 [Aspergillus steynii IBT 23096]|uniref:Nucleoside phosphorylase domain-containing protein n=1 Tax=Aspergillus steynii IBT 23096 TaxID=1392250 RepID=A0A2I2G4A6_9EURO|nr:uncharacterized protein P170DRAFT_385589 [Aspergillus steynii IBT 23096]PLB47714.1 hypothetical protein P170DRAFT_385589 [Aspergillus steynii IBT 23096]
MRRVAVAMPDCLKTFSLRLSSAESSQQVHRNVTAFIRKYRQDIADAFMTESLDDSSTAPESRAGDNMALEDKMELWNKHDDDEAWSEPIEESNIFPDSGDESPKHPEIETDETLNAAMPGLQKYRECIIGNPAYEWLLSDLQRHSLLAPSSPDVMTEIGSAITQSLLSRPHFSRRESALPYKMTYTMNWDLKTFLEDQEYNEEHFKALPLAITLTGSREAAQALTCSQYLHQTWPSSAGEVLKLLQALLKFEAKNRETCTLPDGTRLVAWFQSSMTSKIIVKVKGPVCSVAEIGEQLSWLGSALRSSPNPDQLVYCQPRVGNFQLIHDKSQNKKRKYAAEASAEISFAMKEQAVSPKANGDCWHDLFRNCVVVEGYPIPRRPEVGAANGLEIPLPMMASLVQANYVNTFLGGLFIKGFSAMLVPTEKHNGVIVWHLVHNKNGDRISYLDSTVTPVEGLIAGRLSQERHILGWCSDAKYLAGTRDAEYKVSSSRLPRPRENGILNRASISSGQMITGGEPFLVGYKDTPFHVSRAGYVKKLKWIIQKSVVLWDEEAKRGWLINGGSALLHLVRASIVHDSTGPFSSECLFRWESLKEGPAHSTRSPESAIAVLLDRTNRALTIYEDEDEHVTFEDRVKHFSNILEQIFDHQIHAIGPDCSGYISKSIPRAHLEGWDFHDLATESDPLRPRLASIAPKGKAWVDFTRSIHAINLLGRGFGEMLEPSNVSCPYWASLPRDQYYLATGIPDLQMALEYTGDLGTNPIRLSENLVWHKPEMAFESCGCTGANPEHTDMVQVILPVTLSGTQEKGNDPIDLAQNGAVVFGYNRNFRWRWRDTGDPERDDIEVNEEDYLSSSYDGRPETRNTLYVTSESDYTKLSSTPASSIGTTATSSVQTESARPKPLVRSYTKWKLESLRSEHYAVGIVCALPLELFAVRALFDQTHPDLPLSAADSNHYALGSIGRHNVVAACLPDGEYGTNSAADVASNLKRSFPLVKFCLLVGIGGGVPSSRNDIRLGDVVVSRPIGISPGVIQYDMGKALESGVFEQNGFLQPPPRLVRTALSNLKSDPHLPKAPLQEYIEDIAALRKEYQHPGPENDRLFFSLYVHNSEHTTCDSCSAAYVISRTSRSDHHPRIHYGLIASGNSVMKDAKLRDKWSSEKDVLCFEMEAAGVVNTLPCLVIRGICDYADSHKNKRFQKYAAATAASYAKLLLSYIKDSSDVNGTALRSTKDDLSLLGVLRRAFSYLHPQQEV